MNVTTVPIYIPSFAPTTAALFTPAQKVMYVASSLFCVAFAWFFWRVAKRPLEVDEKYLNRLQIMYNTLTACIFAVFVCVAMPHATMRAELGMNPGYTVYAVAAFGMVFGFLTMFTIYSCSNVLHSNPNWITPSNVFENQEPLLNRRTLETNDYATINDVNSFSETYISAMDKYKDQNKRFFTFFVLYVVIMYMTVIDGFFVVYWADKTVHPTDTGRWAMIMASWIVRLAYSAVVYCGLIHAMIHTIPATRWYKYLYSYKAFIFYHFVALVCSAIPMLMDMTTADATYIIQRIPFTLAYGMCSGVLLWFLSYYIWIHDPQMTKRGVRTRLVLITGISLLLATAGLFV